MFDDTPQSKPYIFTYRTIFMYIHSKTNFFSDSHTNILYLGSHAPDWLKDYERNRGLPEELLNPPDPNCTVLLGRKCTSLYPLVIIIAD